MGQVSKDELERSLATTDYTAITAGHVIALL